MNDMAPQSHSSIEARYAHVRGQTVALCKDLSDADMTVQSMPDASPAKWHLAHTTWFFETLILAPNNPEYQLFNEDFNFLFNSYYESVGERHARPRRGMLTRPSREEVLAYRAHVDAAMTEFLSKGLSDDLSDLVVLGLNHEEQHQELLLTDILHMFAQNPISPSFKAEPIATGQSEATPMGFLDFEGGIHSIGHDGNSFAYDCEGPRHEVLLRPYRLADRLVTNGEWLEFMKDGGYRDPLLWLSDGWAQVVANEWNAPLYWREKEGEWRAMSLHGEVEIDKNAPVTHVSFYEAEAFARWAGKRLASEAEWEVAARHQVMDGNFMHGDSLMRPQAAGPQNGQLRQMFGDCWEWTGSAFLPFPGFKPVEGAVGEYNGKFMSGQSVLRGGSCATPLGHIRATYRNFFYPQQRWQFTGVRLAEDAA